MTEPTGGPAATDTEGWSAGNEVESLQGAARWLVGASAAVGAALLAGTQVSALTRLTPDNPVQLAIAITACIISLVAVGVILVRATRVLVHPDWTLNKLAHQDFDKKRRKKHKHLYDELESQRGLLIPNTELKYSPLYRQYRKLMTAWDELHDKGQTDLPDDLSLETTPTRTYRVTSADDVARLQQRFNNVTAAATRLSSAANLIEVRWRYRRLIRVLPFMGAFILVSVLVFSWITGTVSDMQVTSPTQARIQFTDNPGELLSADVPTGCAALTVDGVVVGGSFQDPVVVSASDSRCILNQVEIGREQAIVIPLLTSRTPSATQPG